MLGPRKTKACILEGELRKCREENAEAASDLIEAIARIRKARVVLIEDIRRNKQRVN